MKPNVVKEQIQLTWSHSTTARLEINLPNNVILQESLSPLSEPCVLCDGHSQRLIAAARLYSVFSHLWKNLRRPVPEYSGWPLEWRWAPVPQAAETRLRGGRGENEGVTLEP